jgi:NADPH-dependent ferric siderophore reductase
VTETSTEVSPYTLCHTEVLRTVQLTPHLRRVTFGGPDLRRCTTAGLDQRIKLFLPRPDQERPPVPTGPNWYDEYRRMADDVRPPMRTYTLRGLRPDELDVDFALHGDIGPASAWAGRATPGDRVAILAPDARHSPITGYEYQPSADTDWELIAGDDAALPAIAGIVEALPEGRRALVFVEVDSLAEMMPMETVGDVTITWLPRGARSGLLRTAIENTTFPTGRPYAWLAAESRTATGLRRHLVNERGVEKESVYFSGYWLLGSAIE